MGAQTMGDALVRHWAATLVDINTPGAVVAAMMEPSAAAGQLSGIKQTHRDSMVNAFAIAAAGANNTSGVALQGAAAEHAGIVAVDVMFARRLCVLQRMADALPTVCTKAGEVFGEGTPESEVYRSCLIISLCAGFDWWRKALE